jgi:hypothetical protein
MKKPLLAALLLIGALSFIDAAPPAVRLPGSIVLMYYLPGLAFLLLLGDRRRPALDALYLPPLLSPIIVVLLMLAVHRATGSLRGAMTASVLIPAFIVVVASLVPGKDRSAAAAPVPRSILFISFGFAGAILTAYLLNGFLLVRSDAWYHISIVGEILNRGIPPKDPWFADQSIRYMWSYHLFIAGFIERSRLSIPMALGLFNVINAFIFPYLVARLTALYKQDKRYVLGTPLFALAGIQCASWILWPVRLIGAFSGEVRGSAEIARIVRGIDVNSWHVLDFLAPWGTFIVSLLDKFFVITALNHALNLFLLCFVIIVSVRFDAKFAAKASVTAFLAMLGAFLFHVVIGTALILTVIGSGMLLAMLRLLRSRKGEKLSVYHSLVIPGVAVLVGAAALPYLASLSAGGQTGTSTMRHLHVGIRSALTIAAPLAVLFFPARAAVKELLTFRKDEYKILLAWMVCLAGLSLFVDLPTVNESKFIIVLFLLLTPPVVWQIIDDFQRTRGLRRAAVALGICVLFVAPLVLTVRGFYLQRPTDPTEVRRAAVSKSEWELFAWIRENTPSDAVFIEGNDYNWMPVFGKRRSFMANRQTIDVFGYRNEEVERCLRVRQALFSDAVPAKEDIDFLRDMKLHIYIVVWHEDEERIPGLEAKLASRPAWFEQVYRGAAGSIYRLQPQEPAR